MRREGFIIINLLLLQFAVMFKLDETCVGWYMSIDVHEERTEGWIGRCRVSDHIDRIAVCFDRTARFFEVVCAGCVLCILGVYLPSVCVGVDQDFEKCVPSPCLVEKQNGPNRRRGL